MFNFQRQITVDDDMQCDLSKQLISLKLTSLKTAGNWELFNLINKWHKNWKNKWNCEFAHWCHHTGVGPGNCSSKGRSCAGVIAQYERTSHKILVKINDTIDLLKSISDWNYENICFENRKVKGYHDHRVSGSSFGQFFSRCFICWSKIFSQDPSHLITIHWNIALF